MDPETSAGDPPVTPPVGTTPEPVLTADPPKTETFDAEYVKKLRSEAAARRKEATDLAAQLKALEDEKLSATERVAKELKAAQDQIAVLTYESPLR
jgi:hypothetical protein